MSLLYKNRVAETTGTGGTGTITGAGAVAQYQSLAAYPTGQQCSYTLLSGNGTDWECGQGTVTISGGTRTMSRDTVEDSSASGAKISLTGTSTVFCTILASRAALSPTALWGTVMTGVPTSTSTGLTTWLNQGTASVADTSTGVTITAPAQAGFSMRCRYKAAPTPPYAIKALVALNGPPLAVASNIVNTGIGWHDGTKLSHIGIQVNGTAGVIIYVENWTNISTPSATVFGKALWMPIAWFRLRDDATTVYFEISMSGDDSDFVTLYSIAKASGFLGSGGYSNVFFYADRQGTSAPNVSAKSTLMQWLQS